LLKAAIELEPDKPDLHNNLAAAYDAQGRQDEAFDLLEQIHERWPDYFFGRVGMAQRCIKNGEYDKAEEYLDPLRKRTRLHTTEFAALCGGFVRLYLGKKEIDAAESWLKMLENVEPDHPFVEQFKPLFTLSGAMSKLMGMGRGGRRKNRKR
jgi:tetratricopeptide (TPR) repeat protein